MTKCDFQSALSVTQHIFAHAGDNAKALPLQNTHAHTQSPTSPLSPPLSAVHLCGARGHVTIKYLGANYVQTFQSVER